MDDDPERPAGTDCDGRLDVQVLLGDALAGPVDVLLGGFADRPDQVALVAAQAQLRADAEQGGECDALDEPPAVVSPSPPYSHTCSTILLCEAEPGYRLTTAKGTVDQ